MKHSLSQLLAPVHSLAWRPGYFRQLLTCAPKDKVPLRLWDASHGLCLCKFVNERATVCGWSPDGEKIVAGLQDKSIFLCDAFGSSPTQIGDDLIEEGSDIVVINQHKIITKLTEKQLCVLSKKACRPVRMEAVISSFTASKNRKFVLVNLLNGGIRMFPEEGVTFKGHKQESLRIKSCFEGDADEYVASGSEDSKVYIWRRSTQEIMASLSGHSSAVTVVSWHPSNQHLLASAGKDGTIRIWTC